MEKSIGNVEVFNFVLQIQALLQSRCGPNVEEANDFVALRTQTAFLKLDICGCYVWMPMHSILKGIVSCFMQFLIIIYMKYLK